MNHSSPPSRRAGIAAAFLVAALFAVLQAAALRAHPASCPPLHENAPFKSPVFPDTRTGWAVK